MRKFTICSFLHCSVRKLTICSFLHGTVRKSTIFSFLHGSVRKWTIYLLIPAHYMCRLRLISSLLPPSFVPAYLYPWMIAQNRFSTTPFDGKFINLQMSPIQFYASSYRFRYIKFSVLPSKNRSTSLSTIFAITSFHGKCVTLQMSPSLFALALTSSGV